MMELRDHLSVAHVTSHLEAQYPIHVKTISRLDWNVSRVDLTVEDDTSNGKYDTSWVAPVFVRLLPLVQRRMMRMMCTA
jgi:hypothetical protein